MNGEGKDFIRLIGVWGQHVTPLYLSSVHALLTCTILSVIRSLTTYVYYRPVYPRYRTHFGLSRYLDT